MIVHKVEQGGPEWLRLRLGIPTASCFKRIIQPVNLKPSKSADKYACDLVAERLIGEPLDAASSKFMQRGSDMEEEAVSWYEMTRDVDIDRVGFVTNDDHTVGCSPDGHVGDNGGIEIKCLEAGNCVYDIHKPEKLVADYRLQVQGCLWVTGRKWWDLISYHPTIEPTVIRCERDEECISAIAKAIDCFQDVLADIWNKLKE